MSKSSGKKSNKSGAKTAQRVKTSKSSSAKNSVTEITHEEAKKYLQKYEQAYLVDEDSDSEDLNAAEGDCFLNQQHVSQVGYDSDNDDTIIRNLTVSDTTPASPDMCDSDDEGDNLQTLRNIYRSQRGV